MSVQNSLVMSTFDTAPLVQARELLESGIEIWGRGNSPGDTNAEHQHLHIIDAAGEELLNIMIDYFLIWTCCRRGTPRRMDRGEV